LVVPTNGRLDIPLTYYSGKNLPFGIGLDANVTYAQTTGETVSRIQPYNLSINVNTPFTLLFGFGDHDSDLKEDYTLTYTIFEIEHTMQG